MDVKTVQDMGELDLSLITPQVVEEDSKLRCQHSRITNQCRFEVVPSQEYCKYHVALHVASFRKQSQLKKYKLVQHYTRINEICSSPQIKNLQEEVGILNYTLETLMNQCHTPWDIQVNQHKIESLIERISKTMMLSHKLETQLGQVLDRQTLATFVDEIIRVVSEEVTEPERLERIGRRIGDAVERAQAPASAAALSKDK